jgi:hypothetical protein
VAHAPVVLQRLPAASSALGFAAAVLGATVAQARGVEVDRAPRTVPSLFFVAKSENRNQVHYGLRLDDSCAPVGGSPVFAYWRMFERGPLVTEPLLPLEVPAYGLATQRPVENPEGVSRIAVTLNALPARQIVIDSKADGRGCSANARTSIHGVSALLTSVFVQLRWPFGVQSLVLSGQGPDGRALRERLAR